MTKAQEALIRTLIDTPHIIGNLLGYDKLLPIHSEWIKYIWHTNDSRTLQAHRGSYKTTAIIIIGTLIHTIIKPGDRNLILRKEFDLNVKPIIRELTRLYQTDGVKEITTAAWGYPLEIERADSKEIMLNGPDKRNGTQPNVTGASIYQSLTGQHYDRVLTDDIVTLKDRTSHAEREKVKLQYQELLNIADPGAPISNIGTPWHKQDAFSIMPDANKYDIYSTSIPAFTKEHIQRLRETMSPTLFSANYELKHIVSEDALFAEIKYIGITDYSKYSWVCHIDARYMGKDTTAITFGAKDGEKIVLEGFVYDKHVDDCMGDLKALLAIHKCGTIYMETNADKGYLEKEIVKFHPATRRYHERMNKHVKIVQFLKGKWPEVYLSSQSNPEYITQIADYNEGIEPDDAPDSAASIIREHFYDQGAAIW